MTILAAVALVVLAPVLVLQLFGEGLPGLDRRPSRTRRWRVRHRGPQADRERVDGSSAAQPGELRHRGRVRDDPHTRHPVDPVTRRAGGSDRVHSSYTLGGIVIVLLFTRFLGGHILDFVPRPRDLAAVWRRVRGGSTSGTGDAATPKLADGSEQERPWRGSGAALALPLMNEAIRRAWESAVIERAIDHRG